MIVGFGTLLPTLSIQFRKPLFAVSGASAAIASDMALILSMQCRNVQAFRCRQMRPRDAQPYV